MARQIEIRRRARPRRRRRDDAGRETAADRQLHGQERPGEAAGRHRAAGGQGRRRGAPHRGLGRLRARHPTPRYPAAVADRRVDRRARGRHGAHGAAVLAGDGGQLRSGRRRGGRPHDRGRGPRIRLQHLPRGRREPGARAAQRPQLRIRGRGSAAGRPHGGRSHQRHPGAPRGVDDEALRRQRPRKPAHDGRRHDLARGDAPVGPARVRDRQRPVEAGFRHVLVQPRERPLGVRERVPAEQDLETGLEVQGLCNGRLGRRPLDGGRGERWPRPVHRLPVLQPPRSVLLRQEFQTGDGQGRSVDAPPGRHGAAHPVAAVPDGRVRRSAEGRQDRFRGACKRRAARRRGIARAAQERGQSAAAGEREVGGRHRRPCGQGRAGGRRFVRRDAGRRQCRAEPGADEVAGPRHLHAVGAARGTQGRASESKGRVRERQGHRCGRRAGEAVRGRRRVRDAVDGRGFRRQAGTGRQPGCAGRRRRARESEDNRRRRIGRGDPDAVAAAGAGRAGSVLSRHPRRPGDRAHPDR